MRTLEDTLRNTIDKKDTPAEWDDYNVFTDWIFDKSQKHDQRGTVIDTYFGACGYYATKHKSPEFFDKGYKLIDDVIKHTETVVTEKSVKEEDYVHLYCALFYTRDKYFKRDMVKHISYIKKVIDLAKKYQFETVKSMFMEEDYAELCLFQKERHIYDAKYSYLTDMEQKVSSRLKEAMAMVAGALNE